MGGGAGVRGWFRVESAEFRAYAVVFALTLRVLDFGLGEGM